MTGRNLTKKSGLERTAKALRQEKAKKISRKRGVRLEWNRRRLLELSTVAAISKLSGPIVELGITSDFEKAMLVAEGKALTRAPRKAIRETSDKSARFLQFSAANDVRR